jgi:hypothetical protein
MIVDFSLDLSNYFSVKTELCYRDALAQFGLEIHPHPETCKIGCFIIVFTSPQERHCCCPLSKGSTAGTPYFLRTFQIFIHITRGLTVIA